MYLFSYLALFSVFFYSKRFTDFYNILLQWHLDFVKHSREIREETPHYFNKLILQLYIFVKSSKTIISLFLNYQCLDSIYSSNVY